MNEIEELKKQIEAMTSKERQDLAKLSKILFIGSKNLCKEAQMILVKDENKYVRRNLAANPNLCKEAQIILAEDESFAVRWCLAENENTDKNVLKILLKDDDRDVREAAQKTLEKLNK